MTPLQDSSEPAEIAQVRPDPNARVARFMVAWATVYMSESSPEHEFMM